MLQSDPPPKAVKVTLSKRVPLVGEELAAYEEEQEKIKTEEALKATLVKEEESKSVVGADISKTDPMLIDGHTKADGNFIFFLFYAAEFDLPLWGLCLKMVDD